MENKPVNYMGLVTRRPEPVVISKEQYYNLCKIKMAYDKIQEDTITLEKLQKTVTALSNMDVLKSDTIYLVGGVVVDEDFYKKFTKEMKNLK